MLRPSTTSTCLAPENSSPGESPWGQGFRAADPHPPVPGDPPSTGNANSVVRLDESAVRKGPEPARATPVRGLANSIPSRSPTERVCEENVAPGFALHRTKSWSTSRCQNGQDSKCLKTNFEHYNKSRPALS